MKTKLYVWCGENPLQNGVNMKIKKKSKKLPLHGCSPVTDDNNNSALCGYFLSLTRHSDVDNVGIIISKTQPACGVITASLHTQGQ